ncbi:uncharacterized protein PHALS_03016 [Plasmopara halstedii]|uniref:RxLR-like protein n=1 Tax=Plasmopara halstedii TaxID=4781 RepID=A0A0N7L3P7_PLAHL|nr:uncharacterized protein PHALS_03016 [Plasmopara halstedii]CEG36467.1 hypothetical protein PHALS_03016 [Plasmopara halstedii]|eukprot:XP_024572836.1 hypothetical protein PHALS_03016 [Plasmopara halstedii]
MQFNILHILLIATTIAYTSCLAVSDTTLHRNRQGRRLHSAGAKIIEEIPLTPKEYEKALEILGPILYTDGKTGKMTLQELKELVSEAEVKKLRSSIEHMGVKKASTIKSIATWVGMSGLVAAAFYGVYKFHKNHSHDKADKGSGSKSS